MSTDNDFYIKIMTIKIDLRQIFFCVNPMSYNHMISSYEEKKINLGDLLTDACLHSTYGPNLSDCCVIKSSSLSCLHTSPM
jgi:hypothetical protein